MRQMREKFIKTKGNRKKGDVSRDEKKELLNGFYGIQSGISNLDHGSINKCVIF